MNVQEAIKRTLNIYNEEDEYKAIDEAMDYLLQILKADDEKRIKKAVHKATHSTDDPKESYMSGYRAGWNDALHELAIDGAEELKTRLWMFANKMKRK